MQRSDHVVLVVEDTPLILRLAVELLTEAGFETLEAESADAAIALLEARPDVRLVFTDVHMPGSMDGLKLAHYIRNRWPPVKLIVASGKAVIEESQLPTGARFFPKPYDNATMVETITRLLEDMPG